MTVAEFLRRLQQPPRNVNITRDADGGVEIEIHRGYRDAEWAYMQPPAGDDELLDDEVARAICRRLGVPPGDIGL